MKRILILDDEPAVRQSFMDYFEDRLWFPVQAGSGEEALALLMQERQMAAIVDVRLPGMDGNDFIRSASCSTPLWVLWYVRVHRNTIYRRIFRIWLTFPIESSRSPYET